MHLEKEENPQKIIAAIPVDNTLQSKENKDSTKKKIYSIFDKKSKAFYPFWGLIIAVVSLLKMFWPDLIELTQIRETIITNYDNGQLHEKYKVIRKNDGSFMKDGLYTEFHLNGGKRQQGYYESDKTEDTWVSWYENGKMKSETNFKDGFKNGSCKLFHENGNKKEILNYINDTIEGGVQIWNLNRSIWTKLNFKKGKRHGKYSKLLNGKIFLKAEFFKGKANGDCQAFNKEGSVISRAKLENGFYEQRPKENQPDIDKIKFKGFSTGYTTLGDFELSFLDKGFIPQFIIFKDGSKRINLDGNNLDIPQITEAIFEFNANDVLAQIKLTMPKRNISKYGNGSGRIYNDIRAEFDKNYDLLFERGKNSFKGLGNRFAKFRKGNNLVTIDAPHLSFTMEIIYF